MLAISAPLAKGLQLDGDGLSVCESPVSKVSFVKRCLICTASTKVLLGESRAALVQSMEELTEMVEVNKSKVLMVDCEVEDCTTEVPHLWRRIQLSRKAEGDLFQLSVDGKEFLEKGVCSFTTCISV